MSLKANKQSRNDIQPSSLSRAPKPMMDHVDATFYEAMMNIILNRFRHKEIIKTFYSIVIMILTVFFTIGMGVLVWFLAKSPDENVVAFIGALGVLLSTIYGVPLVVVKFLFNEKEDEILLTQVTSQLTRIGSDSMKHMVKEKEQRQEVEAIEESINKDVAL